MKDAFLVLGEKETLFNRGSKPREFCTDLVKIILTLLLLPHIALLFHSCFSLFFVQPGIKAFRLCHFLDYSFPSVKLILNKFVSFSSVLVLFLFNFQAKAEESKKVKITFCFLYSINLYCIYLPHCSSLLLLLFFLSEYYGTFLNKLVHLYERIFKSIISTNSCSYS